MLRLPLIAMVTDRRRYGPDDATACERLVDAARTAAAAGVDVIQIREPGLDDRQLVDLTRRIVHAARGRPCRIVVNARADVAIAGGAHGVHLRGTSPSAPRVRAKVTQDFIIGRSVHSVDEAVAVGDRGGCDYLIFGSVFSSVSKSGSHPVAGVETLGRVCASVRLPVLAIGGITLDRAAEVAANGAAGIAAIDLFASLPPPAETNVPAPTWTALIAQIRAIFERASHRVRYQQ
jgi:thiamine-phosphate pyrophosphorylase